MTYINRTFFLIVCLITTTHLHLLTSTDERSETIAPHGQALNLLGTRLDCNIHTVYDCVIALLDEAGSAYGQEERTMLTLIVTHQLDNLPRDTTRHNQWADETLALCEAYLHNKNMNHLQPTQKRIFKKRYLAALLCLIGCSWWIYTTLQPSNKTDEIHEPLQERTTCTEEETHALFETQAETIRELDQQIQHLSHRLRQTEKSCNTLKRTCQESISSCQKTMNTILKKLQEYCSMLTELLSEHDRASIKMPHFASFMMKSMSLDGIMKTAQTAESLAQVYENITRNHREQNDYCPFSAAFPTPPQTPPSEKQEPEKQRARPRHRCKH